MKLARDLFYCLFLFFVSLQQTYALSITEMIDFAIANNQKYQQLQTMVSASEFAQDVAEAPSLPQVSIRANHQYIDRSTEDDLYNKSGASVTVSQSIFNKKHTAASSLAALEVKRARMQHEQQMELLLKELADLYFDYTGLGEQLELMGARTNKLQSLLDAEEEKFKVNATSSISLSEVRADYYQSRSQEIIQQSQLDSATDLLISLLGAKLVPPPPKSGDQIDLTMPSGDEQSWVDLAMQNSYGIRFSVLSIEVLEEQITGAKGDYYPNLSVFGTYAWDRSDMTGQDKSNNQRVVGIEFSWLVYGGGVTSSQTSKLRENYRGATFELDYEQKTVADRIRHYWRTLLAGQSAIEAHGLSVQSAYQAYQASELSFDAGVLKYSDLLTRQNNFFNADINLRAARYDFMRNYINLYFSAGLLNRDTFIELASNWIRA